MKTPTILYIEDNLDNMHLVERALQARGYNFVFALSGLEGIEKAKVAHPDVILLDINLPDIDGYEVARRLRDARGTHRVPIIAITANALRGDEQKALDAGCDLYMPKPIRIQELWNQVEACLSKEGDE
ncbi:MAG: response regulator [Anaerolineales bacterium]